MSLDAWIGIRMYLDSLNFDNCMKRFSFHLLKLSNQNGKTDRTLVDQRTDVALFRTRNISGSY